MRLLWYTSDVVMVQIVINQTRWVYVSWVPEVFFFFGATELSSEAAKASRKEVSRRPALLALTLLATGEREDLWHPGHGRYDDKTNQHGVMHILRLKQHKKLRILKGLKSWDLR